MNVNAAHMNIIMNIITKFARIYTPIVVFACGESVKRYRIGKTW